MKIDVVEFLRMGQKRAYSLVEIIIAVGIVALIGFLVVGGEKRIGQKSQAANVAREISSQFAAARAEAQRTGIPVGIAFPGTGASVSQGYYKVKGTQLLRIEKVRDWSSEAPLAYLSWGQIGSETTASVTNLEPFDLSRMVGLDANDPVVIFLPSGELLVDGLATDAQDYILRVGISPNTSGSGRSGTTLTALNDAWEIRLNNQGAVTSAGAPNLPTSSSTGPWTTASLPSSSAAVSVSPRVESLATFPELSTSASGSLLLSGPENKIQLNAVAESPAGVPLFARWSADGGQFSNDDSWFPMVYSSDDNRWKASTLWALPPSPVANYNVRVEVRDQYGNLVGGSSNEELAFEVLPSSFGIITTSRGALLFNQNRIESLNGDGSGFLTLQDEIRRIPPLRTSPDGNTIAIVPVGGTFSSRMLSDVDFMGRDGEELQTTSLTSGIDNFFGWTPLSTRVVVGLYNGTDTDVFETALDGSAPTIIHTIPGSARYATSNDNFTKYAFRYANGGSFSTTYAAIRVYDVTTGTLNEILGTGDAFTRPTAPILSSSGDFLMVRAGTTKLMASDGTGEIDLGTEWPIAFSPDESVVLHYRQNGSLKELHVSQLDGTLLYTLSDYTSVAFSPDSSFFVYTNSLHEIHACDTLTGVTRLIKPTDGRERRVAAVTTRVDI